MRIINDEARLTSSEQETVPPRATMTMIEQKLINLQSLHAERSFTESTVVDDEETKASSGNGIAEKGGEHPGKAQDVQSERSLR